VTGAAGPGPRPAEYGPYLSQLRSQIEDTIRYPLAARRRRLAGTVLVELVVRPSGEIEHVAVVGSSSHALLDNAVIDAIRALHPLPFPAELPRHSLRVQLPIVFDFR
jgi:periplasmic protein TonB